MPDNPLQRLIRRWASRRLQRHFVWITPELVQGPAFPTRQARLVAAMGIGSVLDLREPNGHEAAALVAAGLRYQHLPMPEFETPSLELLQEGAAWALAEMAAGRTVLVHCQQGRSRSACMACAILLNQGHSLPAALAAVRRARPTALLSEGQLQRLAELEREAGRR